LLAVINSKHDKHSLLGPFDLGYRNRSRRPGRLCNGLSHRQGKSSWRCSGFHACGIPGGIPGAMADGRNYPLEHLGRGLAFSFAVSGFYKRPLSCADQGSALLLIFNLAVVRRDFLASCYAKNPFINSFWFIFYLPTPFWIATSTDTCVWSKLKDIWLKNDSEEPVLKGSLFFHDNAQIPCHRDFCGLE